jgi:hypothetical protein
MTPAQLFTLNRVEARASKRQASHQAAPQGSVADLMSMAAMQG